MRVLPLFLALAFTGCGHQGNPLSATPVNPVTTSPKSTSVPVFVAPGGWTDSFNGTLPARWQISNYGAGVGGTLFEQANVDLSQGMLGLRLTVLPSGEAHGAEVQTIDRYGFGTYTWRARMSSTATSPLGGGVWQSGATSGLFTYFNNSQTELDFENEDQYPEWVHFSTWKDGRLATAASHVGASIYQDFHDYSVTWTAQNASYAIDGRVVYIETTNVPQTPAYIMMNHWATDATDWGGRMTVGTRWMWIQSVSFQPQ